MTVPLVVAVLSALVGALVGAGAGAGWTRYLARRARAAGQPEADPSTGADGPTPELPTDVSGAARDERDAALAERDAAFVERDALRAELAAARPAPAGSVPADAPPADPSAQRPHPVVDGLVEMYDRVTVARRREDGDRLAWAHASLTDLLARCDVLPVQAEGAVDPRRHRVVAVVSAQEPELDECVAETVRIGFAWRGELVRPAEVTAYVHDA